MTNAPARQQQEQALDDVSSTLLIPLAARAFVLLLAPHALGWYRRLRATR